MISQDNISLRCLNIDSRNRSSGTASDFSFELLEAVEKPRGCVCWVTDASVPTAWQNVSENENILYLNETRAGQTVKLALPLEPGEYRYSDFRTAIQTAINNRSGSILESEVTYDVHDYDTNTIGIDLLYKGSGTRLDFSGQYDVPAGVTTILTFVRRDVLYVPGGFEWVANPTYDLTTHPWSLSNGGHASFAYLSPVIFHGGGDISSAEGTWTLLSSGLPPASHYLVAMG